MKTGNVEDSVSEALLSFANIEFYQRISEKLSTFYGDLGVGIDVKGFPLA